MVLRQRTEVLACSQLTDFRGAQYFLERQRVSLRGGRGSFAWDPPHGFLNETKGGQHFWKCVIEI